MARLLSRRFFHLSEVIAKLTNTLRVLDEVTNLARKAMSKLLLSPEGPEEASAKATIDQLKISIQSFRPLSNVNMAVNPDFVVLLNVQSTLILLLEHQFSVARRRYPMPTPLQYCQMIFAVVVVVR